MSRCLHKDRPQFPGYRRFLGEWWDRCDAPRVLRRGAEHGYVPLPGEIGAFLLMHVNDRNVFPHSELFYHSSLLVLRPMELFEQAVISLLAKRLPGKRPQIMLLGPADSVMDFIYVRRFCDALTTMAGCPSHVDVYEMQLGERIKDICRALPWGEHTVTLYLGERGGNYDRAPDADVDLVIQLLVFEKPRTRDCFNFQRWLGPRGIVLYEGDALGEDPFPVIQEVFSPWLVPVCSTLGDIFPTRDSQDARVVTHTFLLQRSATSAVATIKEWGARDCDRIAWKRVWNQVDKMP